MGSKKKTPETLVSHSFKDLKKIIKRKRSRIPAPVATVKKDTPKSDEQIFSDAMEQVQEIKEFRNIPIHNKKRKIAAEHKNGMKNREEYRVLEDVVTGKRRMNLPDTQEYVEWTNPDYRDDIISELHGGRYSVQDSLDIHGYTFEEAELEVERFIRESLMRGLRCIKIIHGRGLRSPDGPVLKKAVIQWLSSRFRKHVIAFVSARQCDGGLGALYALLR